MTLLPNWVTTPGTIATVTEGSTFNFILNATNATGYTLISGVLPSGLVLSSSGAINGIVPLLATGSLFTFTVRATNLAGIADRTFSIAITPLATSWITPSNLGTFINESFFSLQLNANMTPNPLPGSDTPNTPIQQYTLISGELPAGLTFHANGLINGYLSALPLPPSPTTVTYTFTVEADGATPATQTFTLTVTSLGVHAPQWNTISAYELGNGLEGGNLGNIFNGAHYSFQLKSVKPTPGSPGALVYTLISGILPPGITMTSSGLISGTLSSQAVQLYPIIIKISDGVNNVSAVFYFRTNFQPNDNLYWIVNYNTIPVDLTSLTVGESLNFTVNSLSYQITKSSGQTTFDQNLISQITHINGLTLANSFIITLDSTGNYTLYQNYSGSIYNIFSLTVLSSSDYFFDLGNIVINQPSILKVTGISLSQWLRYEVFSGILPPGLTLNVNTGDIEGTPTTIGTYQFKLRIYNYSLIEDLDFSIEVIASSSKPNKLTVRIAEMGKIDWYALKNINLIPHESLFREADINFGMNTLPEVIVLSEIDALTPNVIMATLEAPLALPNIIPTTLTPTNFVYTPVIDSLGNTICEALLLKLKDAFRRSAVTATASPGGLEAIRNVFIASGNATTALENWMNFYFTTILSANQFIINNTLPDFLLGDAITFHGQTLPNPFENDLTYYVIPVSKTNFRLAATLLDAQAGTYISFNVNETINRSGSLQFYFPALPLAYVNVGQGASLAAAYNAEENIVPFGYYTMTANSFTDTFFGSLNGDNLKTGDAIKFWEEPLPGPFIFGYTYYAIVVDANTFKLANSKADALLGNAITITDHIDPRTETAFSGSFKKLLSTQNDTVILDEANTRFNISAEILYIDSSSKMHVFTTETVTVNSITYTNAFYLPNHNLETMMLIEFINQTNLPSPLLNETAYYAIRINKDYFQIATTALNALEGTNIPFTDFSGTLDVDVAKMVFINEISDFEFSTIAVDNVFITNQTSPVETGDIVQLSGTILAPFTALTNYSVIRMAADKSFRLATIAAPTVALVIGTNFSGKLIVSNPEYDVWRR